MYIGRGGVIRWIIQKGVETIADRLFKSPLDKDFGEATEEDIILPDFRCVVSGQLDSLSGPLAHMFHMIDGLTEVHLDKVSKRLPELRINRPVTYAFQVKDNGSPVELQLIMTKQANREVEMDYRSSQTVITLVQVAFNEL